MMIEQQSQRSASPTGAALNYSGEENIMAYQIQIQISPITPYQPYRGWDHVYETKHEAQETKRAALRAGHHAVKIVRIESEPAA